MLHIIEHTLLDSIKLVPFLFLTYLAMEYLEHKAGDKTSRIVRKAGKFGPLIGGVAGVVPQCGFSAAASNLYAGRVISLGTLFAIYLSTSDEMLPILISNSDKIAFSEMLGILALKAGIGIVAGFAVDAALRYLAGGKGNGGAAGEGRHGSVQACEKREQGEATTEEHEHAEQSSAQEGHEHAEQSSAQEGPDNAEYDREHTEHRIYGQEEHYHAGHHHAEHKQEEHYRAGRHHIEHSHQEHHRDHEEHYHIHDLCEHEHCNCEKDGVFLSAVKHTLKITFFIILFTFAINLLLHFVGEDVLASLILDRPVLGPVIAGIVGLVPNCASSVVITQLYVEGVIRLGTMMAGLLVNAGIGLLVLFRVNHNKLETLKITGLLYMIGVVAGIIIELVM